jgi:hypothetical protein
MNLLEQIGDSYFFKINLAESLQTFAKYKTGAAVFPLLESSKTFKFERQG